MRACSEGEAKAKMGNANGKERGGELRDQRRDGRGGQSWKEDEEDENEDV